MCTYLHLWVSAEKLIEGHLVRRRTINVLHCVRRRTIWRHVRKTCNVGRAVPKIGHLFFVCILFFGDAYKTMYRRKSLSETNRQARVAVPFGHGSSVSPMSPPLSTVQNTEYTNELAGISRPFGGAVGCAYTGFDDGIKCQFSGGMPAYVARVDSYTGVWDANVSPDFPVPTSASPGGYAQIMMGGGSGSPECAQDCTCLGDATCPCRNQNGLNCGYVSVNQSCVEPIPNGTYASLASCEAANARGNFA